MCVCTVYVKSFEAKKFRRFRSSPLNYETFPPKLLLHIHMCKVSKDPLRNFYSESSLTWLSTKLFPFETFYVAIRYALRQGRTAVADCPEVKL